MKTTEGIKENEKQAVPPRWLSPFEYWLKATEQGLLQLCWWNWGIGLGKEEGDQSFEAILPAFPA